MIFCVRTILSHMRKKKINKKYHQHAIAHLNLAQNVILNAFHEISRKTEEKKVPLFFGLKQYYGCYGNYKKIKKNAFFSKNSEILLSLLETSGWDWLSNPLR